MSELIIEPSVAKIIPELSEMILAEWGELVEKIIIHGSAIDGKFRPGESDLDVVVLINHPVKNAFKLERAVNERFTGPWSKIELTSKWREGFEALRNFENCFASRVLKGLVIYDSGRVCNVEPLSREAAKREIVEGQLTHAFFILSMTSYLPSDTVWSATRSICRALQTLLILHDLEVHDKSIRWNMRLLLAEVIKFYPEFVGFKEAITALPNDLAEMDNALDIGEESTDLEKRNAVALGIKIIRKIERIIQIKATNNYMKWSKR